MADRSDRRELGRPLLDEVRRDRLIDMLADRWNVRLVLVQAPGGYGKSIAIAQAIRDNDADPTGIDAYCRCRPLHQTVVDVAGEMLAAIGSDAGTSAPADALDKIVKAVSDASPNEVCLHLDDIHSVSEVEGMVEFLDQLVSSLPFNGHLVLIGRRLPQLRLARLRVADSVVEIGPEELAFDSDELGVIAARHHIDPGGLGGTGGWPALTRLRLAAGSSPGLPTDYLGEEIVPGLSDDQRLAIAVAAIAGVADAELLQLSGSSAVPSELLTAVPLMVDYGDGAIGAHDLWYDVIDLLVDSDERTAIATRVVAQLASRGEHHAALSVAIRWGLWEQARHEIMSVLRKNDTEVELAQARRWLGSFPESERTQPELLFLTGLAGRLSGDLAGSLAPVIAAADEFERRGDIDGETTACNELGIRGWLTNDRELRWSASVRSDRLIERGGQRIRWLRASGKAISADLRGDFAAALAKYESIPGPDELMLRHASMLAILVGDADTARRLADELLAQFDSPLVRWHRPVIWWLAGDPKPVLFDTDRRAYATDNQRNHFLAAVYWAMFSACLGLDFDGSEAQRLVWARNREQAMVAVVRAAAGLRSGDESETAAAFAARLEEIGLDDPLVRGELLRFLPYAYVLSLGARTWLEEQDDLGPLHVTQRELARTLIEMRRSASATIGVLPPYESILTWLPLQWSIELAARLARSEDRRGLELAEYLSDTCGATAHVELRRLLPADDDVARGAELILAALPAPSPGRVEVQICGANVVRHDEVVDELSRRRVRQLLQLLALRKDVTRSTAVEMLWPGAEPEKGRGSLRATLVALRRALEPHRVAGEAFFHVRQRGERIWLHRSDAISVDLWEIESALERAAEDERSLRDDEAIENRRAAVQLWAPTSLEDVRDIPDLAGDIADVERRVVHAGCWVAERLLSKGDHDGALRLVELLLAIDASVERIHDVEIAAHLAADDLPGASLAIERCLAALDDHGVAPSTSTEMLLRRYERRSGRFHGPRRSP